VFNIVSEYFDSNGNSSSGDIARYNRLICSPLLSLNDNDSILSCAKVFSYSPSSPASPNAADGTGSISRKIELPGGVSPRVNTACTNNAHVFTELDNKEVAKKFEDSCLKELGDLCALYKKKFETISAIAQNLEMTDICQVINLYLPHPPHTHI
jgi:hypothetical protein